MHPCEISGHHSGLASEMWNKLLRILFLFSALAALFIGIYDLILKMRANECIMTYMFDWPKYITIPLDPELKKKYPKYSLSVYGEGEYAESLNDQEFSGIPVLFIPGNAGTLMQVRSVATVALRKAETLPFHFNYFVVGFSKEMSALKGSYFQTQTKFVNECLKVILRLYKDTDQKTVVLIGNSIGGIIARGLYTLPDFDRTLVKVIITLVTPHTKPVLMVDSHLNQYYSEVNEFWTKHSKMEYLKSALRHVTFLSIGSGTTDIQVRSDLTSMESLGMPNQTISVLCTATPKVWVSPEHNFILWCKQVLLAMTRALIDMVDTNRMQITDDINTRMLALRYHFVSAHSHKNSIKDTVIHKQQSLVHSSQCKVIDKGYFTLVGGKNKACYLLNLRERSGELLTMYTGISENWLFACRDNNSCKNSTNLSFRSDLVPTIESQVAVFRMKIDHIKQYGDWIRFSVEAYTNEKLYVKNDDSVVSQYSINTVLPLVSSKVEISDARVFTRISLPFVRYPWIVYKANITSQCKKSRAVTAVFHIPWFGESTYFIASKLQSIEMAFFHEKPLNFSQNAELQLWHNTRCNFSIRMWIDMKSTSRQFLLFNFETILKSVSMLAILSLITNSERQSNENMKLTALLYLAGSRNQVLSIFRSDEPFTATFVLIYQASASIAILVLLRVFIWMVSLLVKVVVFIPLRIMLKIFGRLMHVYRNSNFFLQLSITFFLEVVIPCLASQFCSSLGILSCFLITIFKRVFSDTVIKHTSELCLIASIVTFPGLIAWAKDLKYSLKQDSDPLIGISLALIVSVFLLNNRTRNYVVRYRPLYSMVALIISVMVPSESYAVYHVPHFITVVAMIYFIFTVPSFSLYS